MADVMKQTKIIYLLICFSCFLFSCTGNRKIESSLQGGDTIPMRHATLLTMVDYGKYIAVSVRNPWDTLQILQQYLLLPHEIDLPDEVLPQGCTIVRVPISKAVVYTSVHAALLAELGVIDSISGVCDGQYSRCDDIIGRLEDKRIVDLGSSMNPDIEKMVMLDPDALFISSFEGGDKGKADRLQIPIIECADYMERSPLARAEWMRFYGRLFGCTDAADSLFCVVERDYLTECALAEDVIKRLGNKKPVLLCDMPMGNVWYQPGGNSTMGRLYRDAGARLLFDNNDKSGGVPYSFEAIVERAISDADVWLLRYNSDSDITKKTLSSDLPVSRKIAPFLENRVWGCNTSHVPFYEQVPFHPEVLLHELVSILFFDKSENRYYSKVVK